MPRHTGREGIFGCVMKEASVADQMARAHGYLGKHQDRAVQTTRPGKRFRGIRLTAARDLRGPPMPAEVISDPKGYRPIARSV